MCKTSSLPFLLFVAFHFVLPFVGGGSAVPKSIDSFFFFSYLILQCFDVIVVVSGVRAVRASQLAQQTFVVGAVCAERCVLCAARVNGIRQPKPAYFRGFIALSSMVCCVHQRLCVSLFAYSISGSSTIPFSLKRDQTTYFRI